MIGIAQPIIEEEEIRAVNEVMQSGMLAQGPRVSELEQAFADYCGTKYAVAVNSGTAAIHCALFAAGVAEGDEVITVPFSFIATANPVLMIGAKPVFVDVDPMTFNIDVDKIEVAITDKTKAILPVHLYGQPCEWSKLQAIADKYNLKIIEDACQAIGADYGDRKAGNLGDLACFSLYATKNIMCGEGGMVTTNNPEYVEAIRRYRQHGMSGPYQYEHIGYNYRITDLQAAIAHEQLKKVDVFNQKRQENAAYFNENLKSIKGLILPRVANSRTHVYHQYTLRVTDEFAISRDKLVEQLRDNGIGAGVYYPRPLHTIEHIAKASVWSNDALTGTNQIVQEVLSLPVHPNVTPDNLSHIVQTVKECAGVA